MYEGVRVKVLVDNHAEEGFEAEHGLSFWVEVKGEQGAVVKKVLFDTGQSGAVLAHNAEKSGVDVREADCLVLSHGHYDHTGGLGHVMKEKPGMVVYGHSNLEIERYSIREVGKAKEIGLPEDVSGVWREIKAKGQVKWTDAGVMLGEGIGVTGFVERKSEYEDVGGPFYVDERKEKADLIEDDQSMWAVTNRGLVIVAGCSHAGIVNTIRQIQRVSGEPRVYAVIGGFHLVNADEERMEKTCEALEAIGVERLAACHCTGKKALEVMAERFDGKYVEVKAGRVFEF